MCVLTLCIVQQLQGSAITYNFAFWAPTDVQEANDEALLISCLLSSAIFPRSINDVEELRCPAECRR